MNITEILIENPVIAAIRNEQELTSAIQKTPKVVFVLSCSILDMKDICERLKQNDKLVFIHMDMVEGLKGDGAGIEFIKRCGADGVISTKPQCIKQAKRSGLLTVQRIFMIDSQSLRTGIQTISDTNPMAIEVMPGVGSRIIQKIQKVMSVPVIAGGLIEDKVEVIEALSSGAIAISTTAQALWDL